MTGTSPRKPRKRAISPPTNQNLLKGNNEGPSRQAKSAAIDHDDLPARLQSAINVSEGQEGMGEFEDAWEDEFEDDEGGSVHFNPDSDAESSSESDEMADDIPGAGKRVDVDVDEEDGLSQLSLLP